MMLWLAFAALSIAALAYVLRPLLRAGANEAPRSSYGVAAALFLAGALGSAALYLHLGAPRLWNAATPAAMPSAGDALAKLAASTEENPTSPGLKQLGDMFFAARQYEPAAKSYERAIALGANDAATWSAYGEAIVMTKDGAVGVPALMAFTHALDADAHEPRARFYVGVAEAEIGDLRMAVAIWRDLEDTSAPDSPWLPMLRERIAAASKEGAFDPEAIPPQPPAIRALKASLAARSPGAPSKP